MIELLNGEVRLQIPVPSTFGRRAALLAPIVCNLDQPPIRIARAFLRCGYRCRSSPGCLLTCGLWHGGLPKNCLPSTNQLRSGYQEKRRLALRHIVTNQTLMSDSAIFFDSSTSSRSSYIALDYGVRGGQMVRSSRWTDGELLGKNAIAMGDIEGIFRAESA